MKSEHLLNLNVGARSTEMSESVPQSYSLFRGRKLVDEKLGFG